MGCGMLRNVKKLRIWEKYLIFASVIKGKEHDMSKMDNRNKLLAAVIKNMTAEDIVKILIDTNKRPIRLIGVVPSFMFKNNQNMQVSDVYFNEENGTVDMTCISVNSIGFVAPCVNVCHARMSDLDEDEVKRFTTCMMGEVLGLGVKGDLELDEIVFEIIKATILNDLPNYIDIDTAVRKYRPSTIGEWFAQHDTKCDLEEFEREYEIECDNE